MRWVRAFSLWIRQRPVLSRWVLRVLPDLPISVRVGNLGKFRIGLRTHRSYWLRDPWEFERVPMTALRSLVESGDVVYDLGANIGLYTRFLVRELNAGTVVAFEPWEENRQRFLRNAQLGRIESKVRLLPYAIADFDGDAAFQVDNVQSTSGTLDAAQPGTPSTGRANIGLPPLVEIVGSRTLDSLVAEGLEPPRVLKIDVEGGEELVLRGAQHLLASHGPDLLIELHGAAIARNVLTFLLARGYACRGFGAAAQPTGYGPFDRGHIPTIQGLYDLHFLVASRDPGRLERLDRAALGHGCAVL